MRAPGTPAAADVLPPPDAENECRAAALLREPASQRRAGFGKAATSDQLEDGKHFEVELARGMVQFAIPQHGVRLPPPDKTRCAPPYRVEVTEYQ